MSTTRKILKAVTLMGGMQAITLACSIVRTKLIALWIGPAGVGLFALFNTVLETMSTGTQLNLRQSSVRDIADASPSQLPKIAEAVRWWALRLGIVGALLMLVLSPVFSFASFGNASMWWGFAALSAAIAMLSVSNGEQAIIQGTGYLPKLAKSVAAGAIIGTIASIPLFYFWRIDSIIPTILIFCLATLVCIVVLRNTPSATQHWRESFAQGKSFISLGAYLTVSSVVTTGASYIFLSYLNQAADTTAVGIYQAGYTLVVKYAGMIFMALSLEFYPRIVKVASKPRSTATVVSHELIIVLALLTPVSIAFALLSPFVIRLLYSAEFMACLPMVLIGIGGILFRAISFCMAYVIIARGDGKTYTFTEVISATIGLALNLAGYILGGYAGLGFSYLLWYVIYAGIIYGVYRCRYRLRIHRRAFIAFIVSLVAIGATIAISYYLTLVV